MINKFENLVDISDDDDIEPETIPICERELTPKCTRSSRKASSTRRESSASDKEKLKKKESFPNSTSPSVLNKEKESVSKSDASRKRPRISFPSPEKIKDVDLKKSRRSEISYKKTGVLGVTTNGSSTSRFPSDMNLKFDESLEEEVPAGKGFIESPLSDSDEVIDDLDREISKKRRLSFIGRYFEAKPKFEKTRTLIGKDGVRYTPFFTKKFVFSNHFPSKFTAHGKTFNCSEQYYMYEKARFFGDTKRAKEILRCTDPKEMKRIGRQVIGFDEKRWDEVSLRVMKSACLFKFKANKDIRYALFETTGSTLVEATKQDKLWGAGLDLLDKDLLDSAKWPGKNQLGYLLTKLREYLMGLPEYQDEVEEVNRVHQHDDNNL